MKVRTLVISILAVLVVSCLSPAQDTDAPPLPQPKSSFEAQTPSPSTHRVQTPAMRRPTAKPKATPHVRPTPPSISPTEVKLFRLRYADAAELAIMIENVFGIPVHPDERLNHIILNVRQEQMQSIKSLIELTDVPGPEVSTSQDVQNLVYRIYMFETSSGDEDMKPFSMILQTTPQFSSTELLNAAKDKNLQISGFHLSDERHREQQNDILIQGKAASNESIKQMVDSIPESRIKELKWDDYETFTNDIAAAQYTQLPEQIQKHIRKFLGEDIQTVGYWFGSSSVPGEIEAPIGPWTLNLSLDVELERTLELRIEVEVPREMSRFDRQLGRDRDDEILSNTMKAKIGKPIIVGYNRESYGTRKMGAMVILLEADTVQLSDSESKAP